MEQRAANDIGGDIHVVPSAGCRSCKYLRSLLHGRFTEPRVASRRGPYRSHAIFWRPWILTKSRPECKTIADAFSLCENPQSTQKPAEYNHPVRLFWPKSKSIAHMYQEANDLLRNFPVQATISFYNDSESDTDNEDDHTEEEPDSGFESE
ncbi:protein ripply2.2-like [Pelodytes ibericus]